MLHARLLTYLDEVDRAGSIRRAAERLGIAASSINRQIIALEAELGVALFERLPRRMRLTAAGEMLIGHVRQTLREEARLRDRLLELQGRRRGVVTLVTMAGLATSLVPGVVAWLGANQPHIKLLVRSMSRAEIIAAVHSGDADLGLGYQMPPDPKLRLLARATLRLGVVVTPNHCLSSARASGGSTGGVMMTRIMAVSVPIRDKKAPAPHIGAGARGAGWGEDHPA